MQLFVVCHYHSFVLKHLTSSFLCVFSGTMAVIKLEGPPQLCKTDEVGELCLSSNYCGTGYWGLQGVSNLMFKVNCGNVTGSSACITLYIQVKV